MRDASICGLGQAASNPLTSVIRYFPDCFDAPQSRPRSKRGYVVMSSNPERRSTEEAEGRSRA